MQKRVLCGTPLALFCHDDLDRISILAGRARKRAIDKGMLLNNESCFVTRWTVLEGSGRSPLVEEFCERSLGFQSHGNLSGSLTGRLPNGRFLSECYQ